MGVILRSPHKNLATLFAGLDLTDALGDQINEMARECFEWICRRHQMKIDRWHARLTMLKNTAYAWRQMIFFLSLPNANVLDFLGWAERYLQDQSEEFRNRFRPAMEGLKFVVEGGSLDSTNNADVRRFLGWTNTRHWLLCVL